MPPPREVVAGRAELLLTVLPVSVSDGGVYTADSLGITASTFERNVAGSGAGIYNENPGSVTMVGSLVGADTADQWGGGIFNAGGAARH